MARFLSWLTTRGGRLFTCTCVGGVGATIFSTPLVLEGPMQYKLKELCQLYDHDKPKPLSDSVRNFVKEVIKDSSLKPEEKKKVKFFNVIGDDVHHFGGYNSPWGALVGVPFTFENPKDINFGAMRLEGHETIDWVIDGSDLLESLTLSEKAKKFGLMKEIYACDFWDVLDKSIVGAVSFLLPASVIKKYNVRSNALFTKPLRSRVRLYIVAYLGGLILYNCMKDPLKHISQLKCDKLAASVSPDYLEGGIEYYEKAILKNKALRHLLGDKGKRRYNEDGGERFFIFAPRLPVRKRLECLNDLKMELKTVPV